MEKSVVLVKDAPNSRVAQALTCLSAEGVNVTSDHLQMNVVTNPTQRSVVAAAMRGDLVSEQIAFRDLLCRENDINGVICEWAGVKFPGTPVIERALNQATEAWGELTVHDRFIPAELGIPQIYKAIYGFNEFCVKERGNLGFKLYHSMNEEWWRTNKDVQHIPTEAGIIHVDFSKVMAPTDVVGSPFNLNQDDQMRWAESDGITSAEELSLLQIRSGYEFGHPLWGYGWARCRNACGSGHSLGVGWYAGPGLGVGRYVQGAYCLIGAVRRKFLALVP